MQGVATYDLDDSDASIRALDPARRRFIASSWAGRAASEAGAAENFRLIARMLRAADGGAELIAIAERGVTDEIGHAELCRRIASAYAGRPLLAQRPRTVHYPSFPGASPALAALLHVVGNCCFNETTATAYLELCLRDSTGAIVRAALRELLSDDVDHARLGWSCLSSTLAADPTLAAPLSRFVLPLTQLNLSTWRVRDTAPDPRADPEHGCPAEADVRATVVESIRALILPGLARAGLEVEEARAWLATAAERMGAAPRTD